MWMYRDNGGSAAREMRVPDVGISVTAGMLDESGDGFARSLTTALYKLRDGGMAPS
jgi:hypothetical protein